MRARHDVDLGAIGWVHSHLPEQNIETRVIARLRLLLADAIEQPAGELDMLAIADREHTRRNFSDDLIPDADEADTGVFRATAFDGEAFRRIAQGSLRLRFESALLPALRMLVVAAVQLVMRGWFAAATHGFNFAPQRFRRFGGVTAVRSAALCGFLRGLRRCLISHRQSAESMADLAGFLILEMQKFHYQRSRRPRPEFF